MSAESELLYNLITDQMFLDNPFDNFWSSVAIPHSVRIYQ
jgi:hypothetical protein